MNKIMKLNRTEKTLKALLRKSKELNRHSTYQWTLRICKCELHFLIALQIPDNMLSS